MLGLAQACRHVQLQLGRLYLTTGSQERIIHTNVDTSTNFDRIRLKNLILLVSLPSVSLNRAEG